MRSFWTLPNWSAQAWYTQHMYLSFYWLAMLNCCLNPIVYYAMNNRWHIVCLSLVYCTVLYCTVLYSTVLYCIERYWTILYWSWFSDSVITFKKCYVSAGGLQAPSLDISTPFLQGSRRGGFHTAVKGRCLTAVIEKCPIAVTERCLTAVPWRPQPAVTGRPQTAVTGRPQTAVAKRCLVKCQHFMINIDFSDSSR